MRSGDFDYDLPKQLIAQYPLSVRDQSRLMVLNREADKIDHKHFHQIIDHVKSGDALVVNETKVFPARLIGRKKTGARVEILLLNKLDENGKSWRALVRPGRRLPPGTEVVIDKSDVFITIGERLNNSDRRVELDTDEQVDKLLNRLGRIPLPPYIGREVAEEDKKRYQTVYARTEGAVAAPTAGLHFTEELLNKMRVKGIKIATVLLHVSWGTFRPVREDDPSNHIMHKEYYKVGAEAAEIINEAMGSGKNIWAVGTTVARTLETVGVKSNGGKALVKPGSGWTNIFIYPPYRFKIVDRLITNFHLPRSTLLMLVSAFAGTELIKKAYQIAVEANYRFYSYGDAMVII